MIQSYFAAWKRPFDFKSRSSRKEYWYFNLLNIFLYLFLRLINRIFIDNSDLLIGDLVNKGFLSVLLMVLSKTIVIFTLLLILGIMWVSIPLTVRRIRDVGMSWKWIFLALIPYLGQIFVLIFLTRTSIQEIEGKYYYLKN